MVLCTTVCPEGMTEQCQWEVLFNLTLERLDHAKSTHRASARSVCG